MHDTIGACLARLVGANSPSLHTLSLACCTAGDDVLRPVFAALAGNITLRTLFLQGNSLSMPYVRDVVLPSLRANSALRRMVLFDADYADMEQRESVPGLLEAEILVAARR